MAERFNFTQQRIDKLPIPDQGRVEYYDADEKRLVCRVSSAGTKTFVVLKKTTDGITKRVTLGRYPDVSVAQARKLATAALKQMSEGIDPNEEKRKQRYRAITLSELLEQYLHDKKDLREKTVTDYREKIRTGFADWQKMPINKITRDMVKTRRNQIEHGVDNKMRVLRLLMKYAHKTLKAIDENPVDVLTDGKLWQKPKRKTRLIASDQLPVWYDAVMNLDHEKAKIYLLLLLHTGLRDQDVRYLEWRDVDFENDCFLVRDTKNHTDFTAFIAPQIKPLLRNLHAVTGKQRYCFPGDNAEGVMNRPVKQIQRIIRQTGIEFSPHDLKRTFLTIGEAAMIPFSLLKALANHKTTSDVTGGYIHAEAKTRKAATFKIADHIQAIVRPETENVISLKARSR